MRERACDMSPQPSRTSVRVLLEGYVVRNGQVVVDGVLDCHAGRDCIHQSHRGHRILPRAPTAHCRSEEALSTPVNQVSL